MAKLDFRDELTGDEKKAVVAASGKVVSFRAGEDMSLQHSKPSHSLLVASGIAARYSLVESGERQITALHILGDFVDLHAFLLTKLDHGVSAMTDVVAVQFPHAALNQITQQHPHLTRMLWLSTILDGAIHRQWLLAMGRMSALAHMAHLFCEQYTRANVVGLVEGKSFSFNLTQTHLADAMGLSPVHVNRTLQELRRRSLIDWEDGIMTVLDWNALQELGQFDDAYLDAVNRPR
jgi:CRP-like cAMP-binding protein